MSRSGGLAWVGERIVAAAKLAVAIHLLDAPAVTAADEQTVRQWFDPDTPAVCDCGGCQTDGPPAH